MDRAADLGGLLRFLVGFATSVAAGYAVFRTSVFDPSGPWFHCVTAGALLAGMLALVRMGRPGLCLSLGLAFALVNVGYAATEGWVHALAESIWSLVLGGGMLLAAVIYDRLAEEGYRFGKFALVGPLVAGVFLAATPLLLIGPPGEEDALGALLRHLFVGLVLGDAVALGIELVELHPVLRQGAAPT
jgi:hypothetical protein